MKTAPNSAATSGAGRAHGTRRARPGVGLLLTALWGIAASGCAATVPMPEAELARRLQDRNPVLVPRGEGPFPAVLLLHTYYGNVGHVDAWAARLRERGYVAAVVNSMRARADRSYVRAA